MGSQIDGIGHLLGGFRMIADLVEQDPVQVEGFGVIG